MRPVHTGRMAEQTLEQIEVSEADMAYLRAEASRCGKSLSALVHDALQKLREAQLSPEPTWPNPVPFAQRMREWDADPDGGGLSDHDPIWSTVGIGESSDGATDVASNKKLYLYGSTVAQTS